MKLLTVLFVAIFSLSAMQCSNSKKAVTTNEMKIEKNASIEAKGAYFQRWIAGQEAGGSGITLFFPNLINKNNYTLKQVYFRGMIGEIQIGKASYFASLKSEKKDLIMSNEENAEYGNTLPNNSEPFPFKLKDTQCVISYEDNNTIKYIQIDGIVEKESQYYPTAPPKNN
ncbi:hypothetical protein [Lacinutrix chionoecetis]